jgi:hypothetical protein
VICILPLRIAAAKSTCALSEDLDTSPLRFR